MFQLFHLLFILSSFHIFLFTFFLLNLCLFTVAFIEHYTMNIPDLYFLYPNVLDVPLDLYLFVFFLFRILILWNFLFPLFTLFFLSIHCSPFFSFIDIYFQKIQHFSKIRNKNQIKYFLPKDLFDEQYLLISIHVTFNKFIIIDDI